jgi:hypothetical protein
VLAHGQARDDVIESAAATEGKRARLLGVTIKAIGAVVDQQASQSFVAPLLK